MTKISEHQDIKQIGPRIRLAMANLTEKERQIAYDCLALGTSIANLSIGEIAKRHNVSPAMIVKVAQRLDFSGFKEMKSALAEYSRLPVVDLHEELYPDDDTATVVAKVFNTAINALHETQAIFDLQAIEQAATAFKNANTIDFYGLGGSGAIAIDAYHKFLRIGIRTNVFTDSHLMVMSTSLLKPGDVAIAFSHSGRTKAIIEAFRLAHQQGATTISITHSPHSPLTEHSDIILCSVAQGSPITGINAASRIAQLCILDALFVLVAQDSYEQSLQNLDKTLGSIVSLRA